MVWYCLRYNSTLMAATVSCGAGPAARAVFMQGNSSSLTLCRTLLVQVSLDMRLLCGMDEAHVRQSCLGGT